MGALEAVLQLKAAKDAQAQQQSDNLTQGLQMFQQARQQAVQNQMANLQLKAGLAEKGLVPDSSTASGFKMDTSLMSPLEKLIQAGQAADANNKIIAAGGKGLDLSSLNMGGSSIPQAPIGGAVGSAINPPQTTAPTTTTDNPGVVSSQDLNVAGVPTSTKIDYPNADAAKSTATEYGKSLQTTKEDFNSLLNLGDNLVASLKAANAQSGGAGPIQGFVGNLASNMGLPDTGNIKAMKAIKRDTALAYSRALVGGARGMATVFSKVLDSLPDTSSTTQQQGSIIAEMNLTAYAMLKAKKQLGLTDSQINKMGPSSLESLISEQKANMTPDETNGLYQAMSDRFSSIAPRKQLDINGPITNAQPNPLSKAIFGSINDVPKFDTSTQKLQKNSKTGEYRVVPI